MSLSVLIAGGGTGGHLYPGIAVARELLARVPDAQVTFVGTPAGIEARVIPREGLTLDMIRSAGLKGKSLPSRLRGIGLLPLSAFDAWRVLSRRRPSVVIGVGGYSSGPVVALARDARHSDAADGAERDAGPDQPICWPGSCSAAAVTYEESIPFFGRQGVHRRQSGEVGVLRTRGGI